MKGSRISIETKLPLAIGALWLVAIVVLSAVAYVHVTGAARDAVNGRLQTAAQNTAGLLEENGHRIIAGARRIASQPAVVDYLTNPGDSAALSGLTRLVTDTVSRSQLAGLALWTADSERVISLGHAAGSNHEELAERLIQQSLSDSGAIGPFLQVGDTVLVPVAVPAVKAVKRLGYLVAWLAVTGSKTTREQIAALLGPHSALYVGSPATGIWTDLVGPVPPPPRDISTDTAMSH
jgi:hypothetical protein